MNDATLLIADLHLDASRPGTLRAALDTFTFARAFSALWILGDLFEAWIGDDAGLDATAGPVGLQVADALARLSAAGTAVHLMHGNRDFLLGDRFAHRSGATLHRQDERLVTLAGEPVLMMHGDTLCSDDVEYQRLRRQLRDPQWQAGFTALPVAERLAAARRLRHASRDAGSRTASAITDVTADTVAARLRASHASHGTTTLVHGHTHRPAVHHLTLPAGSSGQSAVTARRLVLGDWQADGGEAVIADRTGLRPVRCPAGIALPSHG